MSKFNELINSSTPLVVDFAAEWCQPCKMMPPILKQVKRELGDKVRIIKIDVDKNQAVAGKFMIQNVPTLMIFKNGQTVFRQAGVMQAPHIIQEVNKHL